MGLESRMTPEPSMTVFDMSGMFQEAKGFTVRLTTRLRQLICEVFGNGTGMLRIVDGSARQLPTTSVIIAIPRLAQELQRI